MSESKSIELSYAHFEKLHRAAKSLACTPETEAVGTPELMRCRIHALLEVCEDIFRENGEPKTGQT
jgi:hypothetical protein